MSQDAPDAWPINTYWPEPAERVSQHWYISFCLLMSAVQDYLIGASLKHSQNVNWSVTCRYYSMVHAGRLLALVTVGDLPTGHKQLREVFSGAQSGGQTTASTQVKFNWLAGFRGNHQPKTDVAVDCFRDALAAQFASAQDAAGIERQIRDFGRRLCALAELRNEANYESLLIANEKDHVCVSDLFNHMQENAQTVAKKAISLAIGGYRAYLQRNALLEEQRPEHIAASNEYVRCRLQPSILEKVNGCGEARAQLETFASELLMPENTASRDSAIGEVNRRINIAYFNGKNSLFDRVRGKVDALEQLR